MIPDELTTPLEEISEPIPESAPPAAPVTEAPAPETETAPEPETEPAPPAEPEETPADVPAAPAPVVKSVKTRRKPHIALRIFLQLFSFILSVVLFVCVIAGVVLADLRQLTSAGGIRQLIDIVISSSASSAPAPVRPEPAEPAAPAAPRYEGVSLSLLSNTEATGDFDLDLDEIPEDLLTGGGNAENVSGLVDWLYDQVAQSSEAGLSVTKEQMQAFVQKSTISDYLSDKLAQYADDFINGTENAQITTDEIIALLDENKELMKSELDIELTPEQRDSLTDTVRKLVEEEDINATIRGTVNDAVDKVLEDYTEALGGMDREALQQTLQSLTSGALLLGVAGACAVLLLLLCLLNFYNVPAGLTWAAMPCIFAGALMSLPILLLQFSTGTVVGLLPDAAAVVDIASSFAGIFAPIHYGLLGIGLALLIGSVVWRIVRASLRKKKAAAAV